jgi:hypothetical protein
MQHEHEITIKKIKYNSLLWSWSESQFAWSELFGGDRLGQVSRAVDVVTFEDSDVVRQQLHRDDTQNAWKIFNNLPKKTYIHLFE